MIFEKALPIWGKGYVDEKNVTLVFVVNCKKDEFYKLKITCNNFYRMFVNGTFFAYGPSRSAHGFSRVDTYEDIKLEEDNRIVIEVSSYHCNSFYSLNVDPFVQYEIYDKDGKVTHYSDLSTDIYYKSLRIQKVVRFSYQRGFSESYKYKTDDQKFLTIDNGALPKVEPIIVEGAKLLEREVSYPLYHKLAFELFEFGRVKIDEEKEVYDDRYMHLSSLGIFEKSDWEIDSNAVASKLNYVECKSYKNRLCENCFSTYRFPVSKTGFITIDLTAYEDSQIYVIFDEVDTRKKGDKLSELCFYRNTTHNCITYDLEAGKYHLMSFEPYTAKYIRVVVLKGKVNICSVALVEYENPDVNKLKFEFDDDRYTKVVSAARNTLGQNSVDILTDCPSRERAGWLFDSFFSARAEQLFTGENKVEKAFLENYVDCKKDGLPKGMIPMCYPGDGDGTFIPNWALWYIIELRDYYRRTGDMELIVKSIPNIKGLLEYFSKLENEFGLLENLESWVFVEWSKANDESHICGVNYPSNMLYVGALMAASILLQDSRLFEKANKLKEVIKERAFNGTFFVDNAIRVDGKLVNTNNLTETCQYYAFYFNIASKKTHSDLFNTLLTVFGPNRDYENVYPEVCKSNVLPGDFLRLEILNNYGYQQEVLNESVDYFYNMACLTGTLWEHDSLFASLNHAFASYIANVILSPLIGLVSINGCDNTITFKKDYLGKNVKISIPLKNTTGIVVEITDGNRRISIPDDYLLIIEG